MTHKQKGNIFTRLLQIYLDVKIIWKLIIGFGFVLLTAFFIVYISQVNINKINENVNSIIEDQLVPLVYLEDIRSYIGELEVSTKDALLNNDEVALNYIRNEYLPKTVRNTVEFSFTKLIENTSGINKKFYNKGRIFKHSSSSDRRMMSETAQVLKELHDYWGNYYRNYQKLLENISVASDPEFMKEEKQLRYFLIGGIDRLVETYYRQQAIVARTETERIFQQQQVFTGILLAVAVVLALGISVLTAWTIVTPLARMTSASRKIAMGELKVTLPENRRDELGEVSRCFNLMINELVLLVEKIKIAADNVHENSRRLLDGTQIATSVTQQLVETLSEVAVGADTQQQRVILIHAAIQTITRFSQAVNEVTHRVEELSSDSVAKALVGEEVASRAVDKMKSVQQFMVVSNEMMNNLQILSNEVEEMVLTVKEIGEQINLLSLNAAIEAARAGESGRGFSIVAKSIGELADRTKKATGQVQDLVGRIQKTFVTLSEMIKTENVAMSEGEQAVTGIYELFESIIKTAKQVNQELGEVTNCTMKLTEEHSAVLKAVGQITDIAMKHKAGTEQASNAAEEHFSYTQEMISSSQVLAYWGDNLRQAVNRFTIGHEKNINSLKEVS